MNTIKQAATLLLGAILLVGCASNNSNGAGGDTAKKAPDNGVSVDGAKNFAGKTDVVIGNFSVTFVTFDKSSAMATDPRLIGGSNGYAKSTLRARLTGVDDSVFQTITDNIYADFKSKLAAAGYNLVDPSRLTNGKGYNKVKFEASPVRHTSSFKSITGGTREDVVFAPTGRELIESMGNINMLPYVIYDIALKEKISVLNVNYTIHFAGFSGNTDFAAGYFGGSDHYNAKVNMGQNVQAEAASTGIGVANGLESTFNHPNSVLRLTRNLATAEAFGTVVDATSTAQKLGNAVSGLLGAFSGGSASAKEVNIQADPAKYQTLASKTLLDVNSRFVQSMVALR